MARKNVWGAPYRIEPLGPNHVRGVFQCGVPELENYLNHQSGQDQRRGLAAVFVLTPDGKTVAGFYTLSAHSILAGDLPLSISKKLPRFPIPVTLLGRMAIEDSLQGQGFGQFLLLDALERAYLGSLQVASWAVVVDAKAGAREFYIKHDFIPFPSQPARLFLPMKTIETMFES